MISRRRFLETAGAAAAAGVLAPTQFLRSQEPGDRPARPEGVRVVNPRGRVPLSFIIDDSTCLVNLAHFCIPQFAEVFPANYKQPWKTLPREIPDVFVRKFGNWCQDHGIKGKYSIVPYPACVGWVDKEMPGWSRRELEESIKLVRTELLPNWDIHPEMVTHTWVIDTKTGRPYPERSERFMENWRWTDGKSVDELANYLAYALLVLKNAGLPCEGITTPGGFGNRVLPQLSQATLESCRDVFRAEIPHYFRHLFTDNRSVAPRVEYASGLGGDDPKCVVSIIGCTGDWFGGWDGLTPGNVDLFITRDLKGGRLPQVIDKGEPAILVCHWPGIYYNGEEIGFDIFKEVVNRLNSRYDHLLWLKLSEISRYWAAKELTSIERTESGLKLTAPFATPLFTLEIDSQRKAAPVLRAAGEKRELREAMTKLTLDSSTWRYENGKLLACFDLPQGVAHLDLAA